MLSRQFRTQAEMLDTAFDAKLLRFHRRHAEMEKLIATFDTRIQALEHRHGVTSPSLFVPYEQKAQEAEKR